MPPRHPDLVIAELAARQHGIVARGQLLAAGISDAAIAHRLRTKRLYRIRAGVYSIQERPAALGLYLAAVLDCGGGAVLSHRSAAALWDLRAEGGRRVEVSVPHRGVRRRPGVLVHTTRSLLLCEQANRDEIPCTSLARTIVDLGAVLPGHDVRRVLERSMVLTLFDRRALDGALARANGRRGTGTLRRLLNELDDPPPTRSEFERRFLDLVRSASLPSPITNGLVLGYEVDFHWPDAKLIVETDGRETHATPFAFERDRARDLDLKLADWEVIRISWRQLRDEPERIVALLRAKLRGL